MDVNMPEMATGNGPVEVPEATKIRTTGVECRDIKNGQVECGTLKIGGDKVFTFKK